VSGGPGDRLSPVIVARGGQRPGHVGQCPHLPARVGDGLGGPQGVAGQRPGPVMVADGSRPGHAGQRPPLIERAGDGPGDPLCLADQGLGPGVVASDRHRPGDVGQGRCPVLQPGDGPGEGFGAEGLPEGYPDHWKLVRDLGVAVREPVAVPR